MDTQKIVSLRPKVNPKSAAGRVSDDPADDAEQNIIDPRAPFATARKFRKMLFTDDGRPILHYYQGGFFSWNGSSYQALHNDDLRARLYSYLDGCVRETKDGSLAPFKPNR